MAVDIEPQGLLNLHLMWSQVSMPGMMDTVLNLGLNDEVVAGLAQKAGARFAWDTYRRFLDMFASVVLGIEHRNFEQQMTALKVRAANVPVLLLLCSC